MSHQDLVYIPPPPRWDASPELGSRPPLEERCLTKTTLHPLFTRWDASSKLGPSLPLQVRCLTRARANTLSQMRWFTRTRSKTIISGEMSHQDYPPPPFTWWDASPKLGLSLPLQVRCLTRARANLLSQMRCLTRTRSKTITPGEMSQQDYPSPPLTRWDASPELGKRPSFQVRCLTRTWFTPFPGEMPHQDLSQPTFSARYPIRADQVLPMSLILRLKFWSLFFFDWNYFFWF